MVTIYERMIGTDNLGKPIYQYGGLSTDPKPTDCGVNSLFLELDKKEVYYFDGSTWNKVGGAA